MKNREIFWECAKSEDYSLTYRRGVLPSLLQLRSSVICHVLSSTPEGVAGFKDLRKCVRTTYTYQRKDSVIREAM